jgi:hypothetical protein
MMGIFATTIHSSGGDNKNNWHVRMEEKREKKEKR